MTPARTPAGARVEISRGRRWTNILVDRWPITDATDDQAAAVIALAVRYAILCRAQGCRKPIHYGAGRTIWHITVPRDSETDALEQLYAIESGRLTADVTPANGGAT